MSERDEKLSPRGTYPSGGWQLLWGKINQENGVGSDEGQEGFAILNGMSRKMSPKEVER